MTAWEGFANSGEPLARGELSRQFHLQAHPDVNVYEQRAVILLDRVDIGLLQHGALFQHRAITGVFPLEGDIPNLSLPVPLQGDPTECFEAIAKDRERRNAGAFAQLLAELATGLQQGQST